MKPFPKKVWAIVLASLIPMQISPASVEEEVLLSDPVPGEPYGLNVSTDKYRYDVGENVTITIRNGGNNSMYWPGWPINWCILDENWNPVRMWGGAILLIVVGLGPGNSVNETWDQKYRILNESMGEIPPSGEQVPEGLYRANTTISCMDCAAEMILLNGTAEFVIGQLGKAPVAEAGADQIVHVGDVVQFDGSGSYPKAGWKTMTVDSAGKVGLHTSIALDSNDNPHISYSEYYNQLDADLKYAEWSEGAWNIETVDATGNVGGYTSIALDSNDSPHISYSDIANEDLKYARWTGSNWNIEVVDSAGSPGWGTSIALDSNDNPHISYFDETYDNLKYARWTGGAWKTVTVDFSYSYDVGRHSSIALDSDENPHIGYWDTSYRNLKYAKWTGSKWGIEIVDSAGDVGWHPSIALDSNGYPHMSYFKLTKRDLKYAKWDGNEWNIETLEYGYVNSWSSIDLDTEDNPHISYDRAYLEYVRWTGSSWNTEIADPTLVVGRFNSIELDSYEEPHISYYDVTNGDLKYAKKSGGIVSFDWNFGDGSPHGTGISPTHIYASPGIYNITLTVTDEQGLTDSDYCIITVLGGVPPVADAGPDQTVNEGDTVVFNGTGSYDPDGGAGGWSLKANTPVPTWAGGSTTLNGEVYYIGGEVMDTVISPLSIFQKYSPATDSWSNLTELPAQRSYLGLTTANGRIYAIGGNDGNDSTDTTFEFDPVTNSWTSKAPMPMPLEAFGIASVNDRIYVIGGSSTFIDCYPCGSVFEYDPSTDSWSSKPDMPTGRAYLAATVLDDEIYAIGGDARGSIGAVEVYDSAMESWSRRTNMTTARAGLSAEVLGGNIYAIGGIETWGIPTNISEMYSPSTDSWSFEPSMLESRTYFGSGAVSNCMYVMGGNYGPFITGLPNTTEAYCLDGELTYDWDFGDGSPQGTGARPTHIYDHLGVYIVTLTVTDAQGLTGTDYCIITVLGGIRPVADAGPDQTVNEGDEVHFDGTGSQSSGGTEEYWTLKTNAPVPMSGAGSTTFNGEIYVIGGDLIDHIYRHPIPTSIVQKYNPATDSWSLLPDLPDERAFLGAATVNGKIYAIGGNDGNLSTNTTFVFDPATNNWTLREPMPIPMEAFGTAVVDDRIYVIGGASTFLRCYACGVVFEYDSSTDSWSSEPDMPTGRSRLATAVLEDIIYAIGGNTGDPRGVVEAYDPVAETWTERADVWMGTRGLSAEALEGKIYATGGLVTGPYVPTGTSQVSWLQPWLMNGTQIYDPSLDIWTAGPILNEAKMHAASGVVGNCVYAIGGDGRLYTYDNSTEEYCLDGELTYEWDFDASVDSDGDGNYTNDVDGTGPTPTHVYGDNGIYTVTLKVTDNAGLFDTDTCVVTVLNVAPTADANGPYEGIEGGLVEFTGSHKDPGFLDTHTYEWDFDYDGITFDVDATGQSVSHTWIDDFEGYVALRVTDDDGGEGIDTAHVLVKNVPPTVELKILPIEVDVSLRIAGEKWHDVSIELYEDGVLVAEGSLTRYPGSPNDQMLDLTHIDVDISKQYSATVRYTPEDDPINGQPNGANPCWIILRFNDGEEVRLHHTFNVQHPETYVWEVDLTAAILSHGITFEATAFDPGADDLTFHWDFGDGTDITNFYPNTDNTHPVEITDTVTHAFPGSGTYVVTLTVVDDDNGSCVATVTITIP